MRVSAIIATIACLLVAAPPAQAQGKPTTRATVVTIPNTAVQFELIRAPAGEIVLKNDQGKQTAHKLKPFWIGKTEVTWDEFDVLLHGLDLPDDKRIQGLQKLDALLGPSRRPFFTPDRDWGHSGWPAGSLTLHAARAYCTWLCEKTGHRYRLPTEAEWEYAARAGAGPLAPPNPVLTKLAWYAANADEQTHKVATKAPNPWGLHDMLGNVAEWVMRADGTGVVAGGSFEDEAKDVQTGTRRPYSPDWQRDDPRDPKHRLWLSNGPHVGFRIVREE